MPVSLESDYSAAELEAISAPFLLMRENAFDDELHLYPL